MLLDRRRFLTAAGISAAAVTMGCSAGETRAAEAFAVNLSRAEWKKRLTPQQFHILREGGTERPFSSPLNKIERAGIFHCAGCDNALYSSKTKFESGTGWPSFYAPLKGAVTTRRDGSLGMARIEVLCSRCGGHLGHVFNDGPPPTGKRYCMNGAAMTFAAA
ncbi:peptide-methionine (R)-S-oxide reductase MsrB [Stakelama saccharophila]|uniref:peptide-methionine (R)-S-oxide reductase n=1 Tax=Stakelama saccharophila TaxID=3075605 RepID=A0ABZ0BB01_9SPHN|nr:peptide-methionine (R)-S-oxide reductase MsrB [Stakelama sp. W311]WNO54462.1 peptide-methionine (R)-S-oxide reductase MsrB [Stakelama sp. W311]